MATYKAPLREMRFVLHEMLGVGELAKLPGYEDASPDIIDAILEEAAKICENELQPLNLSGDQEGCTYENGVVRTPKGFKEAYDTFTESGWTALSCDPKYGGQGLPHVIGLVVNEMVCSANMSFGMYPLGVLPLESLITFGLIPNGFKIRATPVFEISFPFRYSGQGRSSRSTKALVISSLDILSVS